MGTKQTDQRSATEGRREEVKCVLELLREWAAKQSDIRAIALVGSWARDSARMNSDVDVVLLTDDVQRFLDEEDWSRELGADAIVRTEQWGSIVERRLRLSSGLELEIGIGSPSWASVQPLDAGTRRVATDGMRALHDPEGILERLRDVIERSL